MSFERPSPFSPGDIAGQADLGHAYGMAGEKWEAEEILHEMQDVQGKKYVSTYDFAIVYAGLRDVNKTLDWLEKGYEERNGRLVNLAVHPQFAFLRGEPRFRNIRKDLEDQNDRGSEAVAWAGAVASLEEVSLTEG